jgi:DNA sulfur modification protein DndD
MKIKSIQLCNFGCYKDKHPVINFSINNEKNVTIILGANKSGKTTLVQAFLWCLYGDDNLRSGIINSVTKSEMQNNTSCEVFVEIILIHNDKEFIIRRIQKYSKSNGNVKSEESILKINYKETNGQQHPIDSYDCKDTVNSILPKGLSDYFFYEGERFVDISKKNVSTAVRGLMGLDAINTARDHLDPKRSSSVTSKMKKSLISGNIEENDRLQKELEKSKDEREKLIERITTNNTEYEYYLRRKDELEEQLSKNSHVKSLQTKRKDLENDCKVIVSNIESYEKQILLDFQKGALSFFSIPLIERALSIIENPKQNDEGIPQMRQPSIDHILERGRCICGLDLRDNEGAKKRILLERNLLPPEYLGTILYTHKQTFLSFIAASTDYKEIIDNNHQNRRKNIRFLDGKRKEIENISIEIQSIGSIDIGAIESDYQQNEDKLRELIALKEKYLVDKGSGEKTIEDLEKKINSIVDKTDSNRKIQQYITYAEEIYNLLNIKYSEREKEVRSALVESVNCIFSEMYHGHRKVLIDDNYQIKLLTEIGSSQEEIADTGGLRAIKNFAYITGLVDIARKRVAKNKETGEEDTNETEPYPLIMDAPFSATDENHIQNISKIIPGIAEQVIIIVMQKDWAYAKADMENRIGKKYIIENIDNSETSSKIREGD